MNRIRAATLALLVPVSLVPYLPSHVSAQPAPPDAATLLHQSIAAMKTVQYLHTVTVIKGTTSQPSSTFNLRVAGDCHMPIAASWSSGLRVSARVQGTVPVAAPPLITRVPKTNARYIIFTSAHPRAWERSARTKNRWVRLRRNDLTVEMASLIMEDYPSMLCPYVRYSSLDYPDVLKQLTVSNEGTESVRGHEAWHIVVGGMGQIANQRVHFFIDQHSSTWLRTIYSVTANGVVGTTAGDYSRLNKPVRIVAPKVGSTVP